LALQIATWAIGEVAAKTEAATYFERLCRLSQDRYSALVYPCSQSKCASNRLRGACSDEFAFNKRGFSLRASASKLPKPKLRVIAGEIEANEKGNFRAL